MKAIVAVEPWEDRYGILLCRDAPEGRYVVEPVQFVIRLIKEGDRIEPTFRLDPPTMKELAKAISDMGIKTEDTHKLEGVLEATKFHLADMRDLVFKKK